MVVGVNLSRIAMDVNNLLVTIRVDLHWIKLLHVIADTQNHICLVEAKIYIIVDHESNRTKRVGVVVRKDTLAHERRRDRYAETLGETNERFTCVITHSTVSREHNRSLRRSKNFGGTRYLSRRGRCITHYIDLERMMPRGHGHFFDIFWQCKIDGAGTLGLRELERFPNHLRHSFRSRDQLSPLCNGLEHADEIDYLVRFLVYPVQAALRADSDERDAVAVGIRGPE